MANKKYVQTQTLYLAGSGTLVGAVNIVLTSFTDIYDNAITSISSFGDKGYITLEPDTSNEESATFTSVTVNANGTVTLGGVSTILAQSPYTETSGLIRAHAGGTKLVVTDNVAFWNNFGDKNNANTWADVQTFSVPAVQATNPSTASQVANKAYVDGVTVAGAPNANTTTKGIVQEATQAQVDAKTAIGSTGAELYINPSTIRSTLVSDGVSDTGAVNAYVITPSPAITAYTAYQEFTFEPANTNTGASTLNVNGLGAKNIFANNSALTGGEIIAGQVQKVVYDGTQFDLVSSYGNTYNSATGVPKLLDSTQLAGEALTTLQAVSSGFYQSDGGVAFDTSISGQGTAASFTANITIAANTNRIIVVVISTSSATIGTPTVGGIALTQIDYQPLTGAGYLYVGYLVAPTSGIQPVACSFNASDAYTFSAFSFYNAKQTGQPDAHTVVEKDSAAGSITLTPVLPGTLLFGYFGGRSTSSIAPTSLAGANNGIIVINNSTVSSASGYSFYDSAITTQPVSYSGATGAANALGALTIAPAVSPLYGYVIKASAAAPNAYTPGLANTARINFHGFVTNSPSALAAATVQIAGVVTGLSGLLPNKIYYLSDTPGAISATAGTNSRKVGIALTATTLLITNTP